jgi:hypothetical protein
VVVAEQVQLVTLVRVLTQETQLKVLVALEQHHQSQVHL